jgi:hypothetical protein
MPATARWLGLAVLGILIAAAVSIAASKLASQQIGLASEPISAGDALAPASREKAGTARSPRQRDHRRGKSRTHLSAPPETPPAPTTTVPPTIAPQSEEPTHANGDGGDSGGGGGADD